MKLSVSVVMLLSILMVGMGQALAQQVDRPRVPPGDTEGPDIRCREAVTHPGGPDIRAALGRGEMNQQVSFPTRRG
jgi:hypothetical protein